MLEWYHFILDYVLLGDMFVKGACNLKILGWWPSYINKMYYLKSDKRKDYGKSLVLFRKGSILNSLSHFNLSDIILFFHWRIVIEK